MAGLVRSGLEPHREPAGRYEPHLRDGRLVLGLLSNLPRQNCWTIAEWAGEADPHGMQHLLCAVSCDAHTVHDDVPNTSSSTSTTMPRCGSPTGTGDVNQGTHTVGGQRQYTGTAGRIKNFQVAVYLIHASARDTRQWTASCTPTLLDMRPRALPGSGARRRHGTVCATKPELACTMIERFLDAGHHVGRGTGDEAYGLPSSTRDIHEPRAVTAPTPRHINVAVGTSGTAIMRYALHPHDVTLRQSLLTPDWM
ncbi:transposase [Streptomyces antibioticus]|uniref:transposase n=1 Tax=Streptomyces antibioticus TaxID=1890 RepID=UPI0036D906C3